MTFIPRFKISQLFRNCFFGDREFSNCGLVGMRKLDSDRGMKADNRKGRCYCCFS